MGNACDCASLVFGAKDRSAGSLSFGSGLGGGGGSGGINGVGADAAAMEARRAFESYSDYSGTSQRAQHRSGAGSPHEDHQYSDDTGFNQINGGGAGEHDAADMGDGGDGGVAHAKGMLDGSGNARHSGKSSNSSSSSSAAEPKSTASSEELISISQHGPALLSGDQEEKMWEDLRHDLQVLDDELVKDTTSDSLSLESLTTHLRGFVLDNNGMPVLAASRKGPSDVTLESSTVTIANSGDDILSSRPTVQAVVAEAEDALAGLAEFEEDDYDV